MIVEDGTGRADADSYCSVAAADAYNAAAGNASWATAQQAAKEAALVRATIALDGYSFVGTRLTGLQTLEWPRTGAVTRDGHTATGLPTAVRRACALAAYRELTSPGTLQPDQDPAVQSLQAGSVSITYARDGGAVPPEFPQIASLLRPLLRDPRPIFQAEVWYSNDTDDPDLFRIGGTTTDRLDDPAFPPVRVWWP